MTRGHSLEAVVEAGLAPNKRFLERGLRAKKIPGHKHGRNWLMTDQDIEIWLASTRNDAPKSNVVSPAFGLSQASQRRRSA